LCTLLLIRVSRHKVNRHPDFMLLLPKYQVIQRSGTPVAYDRSLAAAFGVKAFELISENRFGEMAALRGTRITSVPLQEVADGIKTVNMSVNKIAKIFFG